MFSQSGNNVKAFQEKRGLQRYLHLNNCRVSLLSVKRFSHVNFRQFQKNQVGKFSVVLLSHMEKTAGNWILSKYRQFYAVQVIELPG